MIISRYEPFVSRAPFLMAPKRKAMDKGSCAKRQRKVMTMGKKIELLDRLAQGEDAASVGRHYGIIELTVRYIRESKSNIRSSVAASAP